MKKLLDYKKFEETEWQGHGSDFLKNYIDFIKRAFSIISIK